MKKILTLLLLIAFSFIPQKVHAIEDPTTFVNNRFGIHILFPSEVEGAAKLVNSSGGDWGYVTIPVQSTDRDLEKWQRFMDDCKKYHIIPIIRIATYPESNYWTRPTVFDPLDFANFLNSLYWPTKNRYIIVYNEPNSNLEWGGQVDAASYAEQLNQTIDTFKQVNPDFFIISAGLDGHAPNSGDLYKNSYSFLREMNKAVPGIFMKIDGFASHSYTNRNFTEDPSVTRAGGVYIYREEAQFLERTFGRKNIPIFITETGWQQSEVSEEQAAAFFNFAFEKIWQEPNIIAITPFLLNGNASAFSGFSMLRADGSPNKIFTTIASLHKNKGEPKLSDQVKPVHQDIIPEIVRNFKDVTAYLAIPHVSPPVRALLKWFFVGS